MVSPKHKSFLSSIYSKQAQRCVFVYISFKNNFYANFETGYNSGEESRLMVCSFYTIPHERDSLRKIVGTKWKFVGGRKVHPRGTHIFLLDSLHRSTLVAQRRSSSSRCIGLIRLDLAESNWPINPQDWIVCCGKPMKTLVVRVYKSLCTYFTAKLLLKWFPILTLDYMPKNFGRSVLQLCMYSEKTLAFREWKKWKASKVTPVLALFTPSCLHFIQ